MTDCIVVGGGLIGMLTARFLQEGGADVLLVDRGRLGQEASWAGGGILSPLYPWRYPDPITDLATYSQARYARLARELHDETGIDPEWTLSGLLMTATSESDVALRWAKGHGFPMESLQGRALHACEPVLAESITNGLWMPEVAQMRNPRLVKALRASLESRALRIREGLEVEGFAIQGGRVTGIRTAEGMLNAGRVLVAGGAWSARLVPDVENAVEIEPVRGQMLLFRGEPGLLSHIVLHRDHYVIPRRDGRIVAGSTLEYVGFDKSTTEEARQVLYTAATAIAPVLAELPIEHHWAGLRPGSPTGLPYIGEHPSVAGLFVNAGHYRNGVVLGLASARIAADLMLGFSPALAAGPYALTEPH